MMVFRKKNLAEKVERLLIEKLRMMVILPRNAAKYEGLVKEKNWDWVFLGTKIVAKRKLAAQLGEEKQYCYARELQEVANESRQSFTNWMASIGKNQKDHNNWWSTSFSYRSPFQTDIYQSYCYLKLISRWMDKDVRCRLIVVDKPFLIMSIRDSFSGQGMLISLGFSENLRALITMGLESVVMFTLALTKSLSWWLLNMIYRVRYRNKLHDLINKSYDVIIYCWIESRCFGDNHKFNDPYLCRLYDLYDRYNISICRMGAMRFPYRLLRKVYHSAEKIIPLSAFIALSDVIKVTMSSLPGVKRPEMLRQGQLDLKMAYLGEYPRTIWTNKLYLLDRLTHKRFWQVVRVEGAFIYPFENQPWEKMMLCGIRESKSERGFKIVGYQHATISQLHMGYYLGDGESSFIPLPDILVTMGDKYKNILDENGFNCPTVNGGSLRYAGNKTREGKKYDNNHLNQRDDQVLVLLSPSVAYSLLLADYTLKLALDSSLKYLLKTHPDVPAAKIKPFFSKSFPPNVELVEGSIESFMDRAGYAIHIGTTAALECMQRGIKVFKYLPEMIDMDPLLGTEIQQNYVTWNEVPKYERTTVEKQINISFFSEPIKERVWLELVTKY